MDTGGVRYILRYFQFGGDSLSDDDTLISQSVLLGWTRQLTPWTSIELLGRASLFRGRIIESQALFVGSPQAEGRGGLFHLCPDPDHSRRRGRSDGYQQLVRATHTSAPEIPAGERWCECFKEHAGQFHSGCLPSESEPRLPN